MNGIIKSEHNGEPIQGLARNLTTKEKQICSVIYKVNQLRAYPLTPLEILEWKDSLVATLGEELDLKKIEFVIFKMMDEQLEFDPKKGIQNIFNALKQVIKTEDGKYKVRDFTW